jgi:CRP-like cAMP-binding protein
MQSGELPHDMYIVILGLVSIEESGQKMVAKGGDFFGETAVLLPLSLQAVRTRSAYALEDSSIACLCYEDLAAVREKHPTISDAMLPFIEQAYAVAAEKLLLESAHVPDTVKYPGQLGCVHERISQMQQQLDRIEGLVTK